MTRVLARRMVKAQGSRSDITVDVDRSGVFRFYQDDDMIEVRWESMADFFEAMQGLGTLYHESTVPPRPPWKPAPKRIPPSGPPPYRV